MKAQMSGSSSSLPANLPDLMARICVSIASRGFLPSRVALSMTLYRAWMSSSKSSRSFMASCNLPHVASSMLKSRQMALTLGSSSFAGSLDAASPPATGTGGAWMLGTCMLAMFLMLACIIIMPIMGFIIIMGFIMGMAEGMPPMPPIIMGPMPPIIMGHGPPIPPAVGSSASSDPMPPMPPSHAPPSAPCTPVFRPIARALPQGRGAQGMCKLGIAAP
mmetsp:Transcript_52111/g.163664  ORF Transcript_52111/g.163664 Transcript_52111/m.163664 type:complete len:219 (+) Transcript_52111:540-1196(+)